MIVHGNNGRHGLAVVLHVARDEEIDIAGYNLMKKMGDHVMGLVLKLLISAVELVLMVC